VEVTTAKSGKYAPLILEQALLHAVHTIFWGMTVFSFGGYNLTFTLHMKQPK